MLRPAHVLQLSVASLLSLAIVMIHSAGMNVESPPGPWQVLTSRHVLYAGVAMMVMLFASQLNVRQFMLVRPRFNALVWCLAASLVLTGLTRIPGVGKTINGASRWLSIGPRSWGLTFQPSELVKWCIVAWLAWWCARRWSTLHRLGDGLIWPMTVVAAACGLIMVEDLGTGILIGAVCVSLLFSAGARFRHLALMVPAAAGMIIWAVLQAPYRLARLSVFLDPWSAPRGAGYQPIQSMLAIAQGGLTGCGLGNSVQKLGYLPADTTDFLFAILCEELGITGAVAVAGLYLVILWTGLIILRRCHDSFGRLLALGILLMVGLQAVINLAVVTVVLPPKGIALPLLSSGGTGWILTAGALGLLAAVDEANRVGVDAAPMVPAVLSVSGSNGCGTLQIEIAGAST